MIDEHIEKHRRLIFWYNILLSTAVVAGLPLIIPMILVSDKRRKTVLQRLGLVIPATGAVYEKKNHGKQRPIWIHALSVGEVISASPLVEKIAADYRHHKVYLSVSTKTGYEIAVSRFGKTADAIFFYPYDLVCSVRTIADRVDPALFIIVESDIWPNFMFEMARRRVPVIFANARLSKRSLAGYRRLSFLITPMLRFFKHICTQSLEDAKRFQALGVRSNRITVTGNIKFEQECSPLPAAEVRNLRQHMHLSKLQKVFLAGSTHKGEEEVLLDVFKRLQSEFNDLVFIIAPRAPERAGSVRRLFQAAGFSAVLRASLDDLAPGSGYDVLIVDRIGVLKNLYAVSDVAFVGGSLVNCGGHNPLEPAAFFKPILFGPDMSDFAEIADLLVSAEAAVRVPDAQSLYESAAGLIRDRQKAADMGARAFQVFSDNKGAVDKTLEVVRTCFEDRRSPVSSAGEAEASAVNVK